MVSMIQQPIKLGGAFDGGSFEVVAHVSCPLGGRCSGAAAASRWEGELALITRCSSDSLYGAVIAEPHRLTAPTKSALGEPRHSGVAILDDSARRPTGSPNRRSGIVVSESA